MTYAVLDGLRIRKNGFCYDMLKGPPKSFFSMCVMQLHTLQVNEIKLIYEKGDEHPLFAPPRPPPHTKRKAYPCKNILNVQIFQ